MENDRRLHEIYVSYFLSPLVVPATLLKLFQENPVSADRELEDLNSLQMTVEANVIAEMDVLLRNCKQEERWRLLCSRRELFRLGGFFYRYAQRRYKKTDHFALPLLGDAVSDSSFLIGSSIVHFLTFQKFCFCEEEVDDVLLVCLSSEHIHESVEAICLLAPDAN